MKKNIINLLASVSVLYVFAGCAPQLARTKYGTTENQWKDYIQESYKDWAPPPTAPPINTSGASDGSFESISIDVAPEPMLENDLTLSETNEDISIPSKKASVSSNSKELTPAEGTTYTVKKGDTLWSISCKFYDNDGTKWKKIQEANKNVLISPGNIKPGLTLAIPTK
jgi:hypothetical protein